MTYMATPQHKNPCLGGHGSYNFCRALLGHYHIHSLSDLCLRVQKKIFKGIKYFYFITYMATPQHKNPCPGGHESYNFGRPFHGHHNNTLSLSDLCLGVEKFLKEIMHFHFMTYVAMPQQQNPCPGGHKI